MKVEDLSPTGILLMNMGGPSSLSDVEPFLREVFNDHDLISLPLQSVLGPMIARVRTPKVRKRYVEIGGGSPLLRWTSIQGAGMIHRLDKICPETAPHKFYIAFRYTPPFISDVLAQMKVDGVKRAIAFPQYPQFSCTTTGSSLNELWRSLRQGGLEREFRWSVIDRWPTHPGFIAAMDDMVCKGLLKFPTEERNDVLLLFSAHSLPMKVVERGDPYPQEVSASVQAVMQALCFSHEYLLSYQSAVGPARWLGPKTEAVIRMLGRHNRRNILVIPIAFVSDHIETLYEIDVEYGKLAKTSGIERFERAPALNDSPVFIDALAAIVEEHLHSSTTCSRQYNLRCPGCRNPLCRTIINPIH